MEGIGEVVITIVRSRDTGRGSASQSAWHRIGGVRSAWRRPLLARATQPFPCELVKHKITYAYRVVENACSHAREIQDGCSADASRAHGTPAASPSRVHAKEGSNRNMAP
jgi:hypothetical protein